MGLFVGVLGCFVIKGKGAALGVWPPSGIVVDG